MAEVKGTLIVKNKLVVDGNATFQKGLASPYLEIHDKKNSDGGTFSPGSWQTRDLTNTIHDDFAVSVDLGNNQFIIPAGTYQIEATAPAVEVGSHTTRLADVTDAAGDNGTTVVLGTAEFAPDTDLWRGDGNQVGSSPGDPAALAVAASAQTRSKIEGRFTITRSTKLEIQHRCEIEKITDGYGISGNFYDTGFVGNVYTSMRMWQIAEQGS
jgi:hypothetical protein